MLDVMGGKDEAYIRKLAREPPANLDDMIYSVFTRISIDPDLDKPSMRKLLMWVTYAKRPLLFGEIDALLLIDSTAANWMLWDQLRGKMSSVFRLTYPRGYNPDSKPAELEKPGIDSTSEISDEGHERDHSEMLGQAESSDNEIDEDAGPIEFDFDGNSDDQGEEEKLSDQDTEHSEDGIEIGRRQHFEDPYTWPQKRTLVDFSHQRFRDVLTIEAGPEPRLAPPLAIFADVLTKDLEMTKQCLAMLRLGAEEDGEYKPHWGNLC